MEDDESTPIEIISMAKGISQSNTIVIGDLNQSSENSENHNQSAPITPATNSKLNSHMSNELEGDVNGQVEQWVVQPAVQGLFV